jgi:anti-anti-sigma regulatory factor
MQMEDAGNRVVVQLGSRKASDVGNDLRGLADTHKGRILEIDMGAVRIINADAVSALVFLNSQAGKDGGRLLLSHVHGFVRAVFRVTNTDSLFEIVEEEGEPSRVVH